MYAAMMLHEFLAAHRVELIERCRSKVARRPAPKASQDELEHGIPLFLDQLIKTLRVEQTAEPLRSRKVSGPSGGGGTPVMSEIGETAALHGRELLQRGFTVEQVVHDYGDLCQAVTDLAVEADAPIGIDEFRTLNRCLDNAIAMAVTEFSYQRDLVVSDKQVHEFNERLGFFAHELRNLLSTAMLALASIKLGNVGLGGSTGALLERSLLELRHLIDRSLADVRITAGLPMQSQLFSLADFIAAVKMSASLEAQVKECTLVVSAVDPRLAIDGDRELLFSAVGNLLQNAFKFTQSHTEVTLNAYADAERILIDVEDKCGGLPKDADTLFHSFTQAAADRSGLGLGLSIARRSVEANHGFLKVRDVPGSGCVFTIDLPRRELPRPRLVVNAN
ncbi:MAG TPA: HAMP domain-containing sensor histidine kinase [Casimicrobiaceae bacterium]|nr:HAMP domain-containing sensor histidine kinase [Casimicrobiaceae bacterium]